MAGSEDNSLSQPQKQEMYRQAQARRLQVGHDGQQLSASEALAPLLRPEPSNPNGFDKPVNMNTLHGKPMVEPVRTDLPSLGQHMQGQELTFNNGNQSMERYNGKLKEGSKVPADLAASIKANGKAFIEFMASQKVDILKTSEFADAGLAGKDGKPDPAKVGALLFAAASLQSGYNKTDGPLRFDNVLSSADLAKLNDPHDRKAIMNIAANVEKGVLSSNPPPRLSGNAVLQEAAQALQNCGVSCPNPNAPVRPTQPQFGGAGIAGNGVEGARC